MSIKAVALFSGGLDSTLAIKVIMEQGIEIVALNYMSPFCKCDKSSGCNSAILDMASQLGVECKRMYLGDEYLEIIKNPKHGYGRNLNPCIDCRILKFKTAKKFMQKIGASFLISGEVLGQRPMSQHRMALRKIEKEAGLEGMILRPLSAKLFPSTLAEKKGWVNREQLLDISGRGRRPQMQLAKDFDIKDYPCPAGGCLLTDPQFSKRIKSLIEYDQFDKKEINFLKTGRFFRVNSKVRLSVGRNEAENNKLQSLASGKDTIFQPLDLPGPSAVARGQLDHISVSKCSQIVAWYTKLGVEVDVKITNTHDSLDKILQVNALSEEELVGLRI